MCKASLNYFRLALLVTGYWLLVTYAYAQEIKSPITVNGDKVEYLQEKKVVTASKNIVVTYKDVTMTCDNITVYLDTKEAIAEGNVKITQKNAYFTGEKIIYNFESKTGHAVKGYVNSSPFYGKSQEMDKVSEKQVNLKRGYVTTCDREKPHYRIQARQIRIYLDDKVIAKHIIFFVGDVPVFYLPYYIQPLKDRSAHITLITGKSDKWGYFGLSSLRYYFSEIAKGRFRVDYREKKGLAEGIDNYYDTKKVGAGSVKFYFTNENDRMAKHTKSEAKLPAEKRWRTQIKHRWDMPNDTIATFEFNSFSDPNFIKDYMYKEYEELSTQAEDYNYLSVITTKDNYVMTLLGRKRYDKFYTVVERLPELKIEIKNFALGKNSPFYYQAALDGVYLNKAFAGSSQKDMDIVRLDAYNQLTYAKRLFGFWSVSPYAGNRQTFFSRNKWGDTNLARNIFNFGIDNSTKIYRIFDVESDLLGMEIHKLRHIITPSANYYHTHQPSISPDNLTQFDSLDSITNANGVTLSLQNKLQTKRAASGDGPMESVDLANLIVSSSFDFTVEKGSWDITDFRRQKFQNVNVLLELNPYPWMFIQHRSTINTKRQAVEQADLDLTARYEDDLLIGASYRYEDVKSGRIGTLLGELNCRLGPEWGVRAYERYNLFGGKRKLEEQEYTLYKDLHCWVLEATYNIRGPFDKPVDKTIWFVLRLKAFPDAAFGFKRQYSRPQPGSTSSHWLEQTNLKY